MRKGAGISALSRQTATASSYSALSTTISQQQVTQLETSLASFREALVSFAAAHRSDIRKDPAFRHQFQKMCAALGIDPLAGSRGGRPAWWADALGLGEWSCELALQVVDVCVSTRERNGGVIEMGELISRVEAMRRGETASSRAKGKGRAVDVPPVGKDGKDSKDETRITEEDVRRALDMLSPLKAGYTLHTAGGVTFVRSVPRELDTDQSMLLVLAQSGRRGVLTERSVRERAGWSAVRARTALEDAVMREGIGWVDDQGPEKEVWLLAAVEFAE